MSTGRQFDMARPVQLRVEWGEAGQEFAEPYETPEYNELTDWTLNVTWKFRRQSAWHTLVCPMRASVSPKVYDSSEEAAKATAERLLRLFMLQFREQAESILKNVPGLSQMGMQFIPR